MMRKPLVSTLFTCLLATLAACREDDPPPVFVELLGRPVALDDQLLFTDARQQYAYLLDVAAAEPKAETIRIGLPPRAVVTERRREHDEALVLCSGRRADGARDAAPAALVRITTEGQSHVYELGTTPFNAVTQSEDGRYAIVYRTGTTDSRTLDNPNELVVVDLDKLPDAAGAVTRKTPDGLGHTLTRVLVSPTLRIAEQDRRLLVVLSAAEVTLFDLTHLDRRATIVQLDESRQIEPEQVVWSKSNPTLYVRARSSDNIFMFRFEAHDNDALGNDFRPTINPLSGGDGPRDIALFGTGSAERLLVVAEQSSQVLVIDPSSSKTTALALQKPAQRILLFEGVSPSDTRVQTRALLYSEKQQAITFVDPEDLSESPEEKLETIQVSSPVTGLFPLLAEGRVMLLQMQGVTLLNLGERTLTPISASAVLTQEAPLFDSERKRLWVGLSQQPWIGTLDIESGMTDEIRLDAAVHSLVPLLGLGRLAVVHADALGYVTLVDLERPAPEHAISVRGFFSSNIFDRGRR